MRSVHIHRHHEEYEGKSRSLPNAPHLTTKSCKRILLVSFSISKFRAQLCKVKQHSKPNLISSLCFVFHSPDNLLQFTYSKFILGIFEMDVRLFLFYISYNFLSIRVVIFVSMKKKKIYQYIPKSHVSLPAIPKYDGHSSLYH